MELGGYQYFSFLITRKNKSRKESVIALSLEAARNGLGYTEGYKVEGVSIDPVLAKLKLKLLTKAPNNKELVSFFKGVSRCLKSGVSLANAIKLTTGQAQNPLFKGVLGQLYVLTAQQGLVLSKSLAQFPSIFNSMMVALVQAGEKTGNLDVVLMELSVRMEKADTVVKNLKSSLYYPFFILFITFVAFVVIVYFVIPQMQSNFEAFDVPLPSITQFYIGLSSYMHAQWIFLPMMLALGYGGYWGMKKFSKTEAYEYLVLKLPIVGSVIHGAILNRSLLALAMLLKAGCDVLSAYTITIDVAGNAVYRRYFRAILERLRAGESPVLAFQEEEQRIGTHGTVLANQVKLSAFSGDMDVFFNEIANQVNEELEIKTRELPKLIQPLLMIVISAAVGSLIAAIYLPTFSLLEGVMK